MEFKSRKTPIRPADGAIEKDPDANLTRRALPANLRHELRTPLNAVIGYSEMLIEVEEESNRNEFARDLEKVRTAGKDMLAIVNEILDPPQSGSEPVDSDIEQIGARLEYALRTPLNTAVGYCELLLENAECLDRKDLIPDLKKILEACRRFLSLIKDLVHFPGIEGGVLDTAIEASDTFSRAKSLVNEIQPIPREDVLAAPPRRSSLLVVDYNEMNRDLLCRRLERQGHLVAVAENGLRALEMIQQNTFDLILLDILMPEMNGYQVLQRLKSDDRWRDVPVIMISALEEIDGVVRCIEMGADDYLTKPFNPVLLRARINNSLEKKRLSDLEKEQKRILNETFGKYVAEEVRDEVLSGRMPLDGEVKEVSVLFADLRSFTPLTESTPPKEVVRILNTYLTEMATAIRKHNGSILRYVGDEIYAVFGAPMPIEDHPRHALRAALEMRRSLTAVNENLRRQGYAPLKHGIGIHSGRVLAAIIGSPDRLAYDLVGDAVNLASRIQGLTRKFGTDILISAETRAAVGDDVTVRRLPPTRVKGKQDPVEIFEVI
ncbi:MAG: response regulator [Deltaproteobacteria bacterium]|nr:response regulator [Deltaproteobacteria bacterium]